VAAVAALLMAVATPAWASHGQSSDTDSVYYATQRWLLSKGYGHQWQVHVHDGVSKTQPDSPGWYWSTRSWGYHSGTQWVSVVAGGGSTQAVGVCNVI